MVTTQSLSHHAACCVRLFTGIVLVAIDVAWPHSKGCHWLQVPEEERQARRDELVALQQEVGERFAEGMVGQEVGSCHAERLVMILQKPEMRDRHLSAGPCSNFGHCKSRASQQQSQLNRSAPSAGGCSG